MTVDRVHDDDAFAGLGKQMGHMGQSAEGAVGGDHLIGGNGPAVAAVKPLAQGFGEPGIGKMHGVAVHHMVCHPVHGIDDRLGGLEVHVSHHHGDGFGVCLHPFDGVGSVAVDDLVEIVSHLDNPFCL